MELYPNAIPDLYAGEPLVLAASYPAVPDRPLLTTAFGQAAGLPWRQTVAGSRERVARHRDAVGAAQDRAARSTAASTGTDEALIRKLVVETALEHHLVSPYTSLVAVDKTPARSAAAALERRDVDNTMPAGARYALALPQTATPAALLRWLGVIALAHRRCRLLARRTQLLTRRES